MSKVDGAKHLALPVEENIVDFGVVVRHARRNRALLDLGPEAEHLSALRFDPADLLRKLLFAACGVALQRLVPLHEAVADVVESLDRFGQRLGEVGQLGLEFADSLAALAGQFGRIGLVVGDGVVDENRDGPIFAVAVDVVQRVLSGRDHGHHFAPGIAACRDDSAADVVGNPADVVHHGRNVGKYVFVLALKNVIGGLPFGADDERIVDKTLAQRVYGRDASLQSEVRCDLLQFLLHVVRSSVF